MSASSARLTAYIKPGIPLNVQAVFQYYAVVDLSSGELCIM